MKNNKTILSINIYWMITIYVVCCTLAFLVSLPIGIITTSMTIVSIIVYIVVLRKAKKIIKNNPNNEKTV